MNNFEMKVKVTAMQAARKAAAILDKNRGLIVSGDIESKRQFDFVTRVDLESEKMIIKTIKQQFPKHDIFAEEQGGGDRQSEYLWIIDPLDGTTNYIHDYPFFSISIALKQADEIIFGLVFDPLREECFYAFKDGGAYLNEEKVVVSPQNDFDKTLIATGFPFRDKTKIDVYVKAFTEVFRQVSGIRRTGSAALDLCYTACGRIEGFWEIGLHAWDIAAGVLIVREAGGMVTDFLGTENFMENGNIVAANPVIHPKLLRICQDHLGEVYMA